MKYILILVWLSVSGKELHIENFVDYPNLKACEAHRDDARSQKGKEDYPTQTDEVYTLKDAYCKKAS
jgi:hypothetical protein